VRQASSRAEVERLQAAEQERERQASLALAHSNRVSRLQLAVAECATHPALALPLWLQDLLPAAVLEVDGQVFQVGICSAPPCLVCRRVSVHGM